MWQHLREERREKELSSEARETHDDGGLGSVWVEELRDQSDRFHEQETSEPVYSARGVWKTRDAGAHASDEQPLNRGTGAALSWPT